MDTALYEKFRSLEANAYALSMLMDCLYAQLSNPVTRVEQTG